MYEAFWGLGDPPFALTPDPRFLLRARRQHDILAELVEGISRQAGVMALVGDVGTGKTLLCRALVSELPATVRSVLVSNPFLSGAELVATILDELGVAHGASSLGELVAVLGRHVAAADAAGRGVVVIIDEAQRMSAEALEQVRVLSTFETATRKLLQVVLVGQPELEELLARRELRQLDQRIGVRCQLLPLTARDTYRYVEHRLRVAGLAGALPFTRGALVRVWQSSRGVPRVINLVADRALAAAWSARASEVTPALVDAAVRRLVGERPSRRPRSLRRAVPAAAAAGILLVGAAAGMVHWGGYRPTGPLARLAPPAAVAPMPSPAGDASDRPERDADEAPVDHLLRAGSMAQLSGSGPVRGVLPAGGERVATSAVQAGDAGPVRAGSALGQAPPIVKTSVDTTAAGVGPLAGAAPAPADGSRAPAGRELVAQLLEMWGIPSNSSAEGEGGSLDGSRALPDVRAAAARHGLAATRLTGIGVADLRAIGLPAIIEVSEGSERRPYLVRGIDRDVAILMAPTGDEARVALDSLSASWTRSAWVVWRDEDRVPAPSGPGPVPAAVVAAIAARLETLGYVSRPLPSSDGEGFRQAVRRFQSAVGLSPDGVAGPATIMALSRLTAGRAAPAVPAGH